MATRLVEFNVAQTVDKAQIWFEHLEHKISKAKLHKNLNKQGHRPARRAMILLACVGKAGRKMLKIKSKPLSPESKSYDELKSILINQCKTNLGLPTLSLCHKFRSLKQRETESIPDFMIRVSEYATKCRFADSRKLMVRNQFIFGLQSEYIKQQLIHDDNLDTAVLALRKAISLEDTSAPKHIANASFNITLGGAQIPSPNNTICVQHCW